MEDLLTAADFYELLAEKERRAAAGSAGSSAEEEAEHTAGVPSRARSTQLRERYLRQAAGLGVLPSYATPPTRHPAARSSAARREAAPYTAPEAYGNGGRVRAAGGQAATRVLGGAPSTSAAADRAMLREALDAGSGGHSSKLGTSRGSAAGQPSRTRAPPCGSDESAESDEASTCSTGFVPYNNYRSGRRAAPNQQAPRAQKALGGLFGGSSDSTGSDSDETNATRGNSTGRRSTRPVRQGRAALYEQQLRSMDRGGSGAAAESGGEVPTEAFMRTWRAVREKQALRKQVVRFLLSAPGEMADPDAAPRAAASSPAPDPASPLAASTRGGPQPPPQPADPASAWSPRPTRLPVQIPLPPSAAAGPRPQLLPPQHAQQEGPRPSAAHAAPQTVYDSRATQTSPVQSAGGAASPPAARVSAASTAAAAATSQAAAGDFSFDSPRTRVSLALSADRSSGGEGGGASGDGSAAGAADAQQRPAGSPPRTPTNSVGGGNLGAGGGGGGARLQAEPFGATGEAGVQDAGRGSISSVGSAALPSGGSLTLGPWASPSSSGRHAGDASPSAARSLPLQTPGPAGGGPGAPAGASALQLQQEAISRDVQALAQRLADMRWRLGG